MQGSQGVCSRTLHEVECSNDIHKVEMFFSCSVFELSSVHCFTAMQERLLDPQLKSQKERTDRFSACFVKSGTVKHQCIRSKEGQIVLVHVSLKSVTVKHQCIFESTISKLCGDGLQSFLPEA